MKDPDMEALHNFISKELSSGFRHTVTIQPHYDALNYEPTDFIESQKINRAVTDDNFILQDAYGLKSDSSRKSIEIIVIPAFNNPLLEAMSEYRQINNTIRRHHKKGWYCKTHYHGLLRLPRWMQRRTDFSISVIQSNLEQAFVGSSVHINYLDNINDRERWASYILDKCRQGLHEPSVILSANM